MTIAAVILHYKNKEDTLKCLSSVHKLLLNNHYLKIIIIDNGTGEKFDIPSGIHLIRLPKNVGFAAGVNTGIKYALSVKNINYLLILNNDVVLPKNLLIKFINLNPDIAGPVLKFLSSDKKWVYDFGGRINWWTGRTYHRHSNNLAIQQFNNLNTDYVSGTCMLVKKDVFEKIGLFNEKFFFYFEDVDFCVRAKKADFTVRVITDAVVYHKLGGSIGRWSNSAIVYNLRSNLIFIIKHLGWKIPIGTVYLMLLTIKIIINRIIYKR